MIQSSMAGLVSCVSKVLLFLFDTNMNTMKKFLSLFTAVLLTATAFGQGEQLYADGTATDQDGNPFEWINYGTQDWAIESAEVVTYRDGTPIPQVTDITQWSNLTSGAWCYFDNDPTKEKLYNWYAVAGIHDNDPNTPNKEFAPEGWHVPTDAEWFTLQNHLIANGYNYDGSTTENKIAKSMASTSGWDERTEEGVPGNNSMSNNRSGFNAYPVGYRRNSGIFVNQDNDSPNFDGGYAILWSSIESSTGAYYRDLDGSDVDLDKASIDKGNGASVRFVRDASSVGANGDILLNGTVSAENNQIKNVADPTEAQDVTTKSYVDNSVSNSYTQLEVDALIAQAVSGLQSQIDALQPSTSVTDQDGNTYEYLTYGDQVWTVENAKTVTYRDGTPIPQVTDNTEWENLTTGAWCYYDNDPAKGKLYNWYAVMGIHDTDPNAPNKELAPEGWHVPSDTECFVLQSYLIQSGYNYDGSTEETSNTNGNKLAKALASKSGWAVSSIVGSPGNNQDLNNSSNFNLIPIGERRSNGYFNNQGQGGGFWTSSDAGDGNSWKRIVAWENESFIRGSSTIRRYGFSVRFVRD
jgi:uncharacterized protein (TIGR02145 family)